jgi:hypothetical protein
MPGALTASEQVEYFRMLAERCRGLAERTSTTESKLLYLRRALDYEQQAEAVITGITEAPSIDAAASMQHRYPIRPR